jgi:hypothetical protein
LHGQLIVDKDANEAISVTKAGEVGFTVWADGSVDAKGVKVAAWPNDDNVVPKSYVDSVAGGGGGGSFDGGTINTTLTLASDERDIDVAQGEAGNLKYNTISKFRWGSGKNFSEQELTMQGNKISELAAPNVGTDAVNKDYCDSSGGSELGRPFKLGASPGTDHYRLGVGEFQMNTTNNLLWTSELADAKFLAFNYKDLDDRTWKAGFAGNYEFPTSFIQLYEGHNMLAWWLYEGWDMDLAFSDYGSPAAGGVLVAIKAYQFTSDVHTLVAGKEYRLHCPWWS